MRKITRRAALASGLAAFAPAPAFAGYRDDFGASRAQRATVIRYESLERAPLLAPPRGVFDLITFPSVVGPLGAYVTPNPMDGQRHPAIIWLTGGETNTLGDVWSPRARSDDQSAAAYRLNGVAMMFPSLRGGNENPGQLEGFYGEVDDVLAAADWLAQQPWIDADRIYLGGHSTGGTLAFLVAEASARFRATFAFGPVGSVTRHYGRDFVRYDLTTLPLNQAIDEALYRAPAYWMPSVRSRLFVIEGTVDGNVDLLREMRESNREFQHNPNIQFVEVRGADHFSVLASANEVIARKILSDTGPTTTVTLTSAELRRGAR